MFPGCSDEKSLTSVTELLFLVSYFNLPPSKILEKQISKTALKVEITFYCFP